MKNELRPNGVKSFESKKFGKLYTIEDADGNAWFPGIGVAKILGFPDPEKALATDVLAEDKMKMSSGILINESGLYSLIFRSNQLSALDFKRWVTGTVLPSIRQHGGYIAGQEKLDKEKYEATIRGIRIEYTKVKKELEKKERVIARQDKAMEKKDRLIEKMEGMLSRARDSWHGAVKARNEKQELLRKANLNLRKEKEFGNDESLRADKYAEELCRSAEQISSLKARIDSLIETLRTAPDKRYTEAELFEMRGVRLCCNKEGFII